MDDNQENRRDGIDKVFDQVMGAFNKIAKGRGTTPPADAGAFFRAIRSKNATEVRKFIDAGFDLDTRNKAGDTALHIAARDNLTALGKLLLEAGASPRAGHGDDPARTPLADAINFGKAEMAELLTRYGGYQPGETGSNGMTLLHRACEKGKTGVVEAMIKAGADGNERTGNGATPLIVAIVQRRTDVAEKLLEFPAVARGVNEFFAATDPKKRTAFQLAVEKGQAVLVGKMLAFGSNVNQPDADGVTPLVHAILKGNIALVRTLLAEGADVNRPGQNAETPLYIACHAPEITDPQLRAALAGCLIRYGADPDRAHPVTKQTPLHAAAQAVNGRETVAVLLQYAPVSQGPDLDGFTPLFYAVAKPDAELLRLMLKAGANPDARHLQDARTPLIEAVQSNSAAAVQALLAHGANPKLYDAHGKSPLSYARAKKLDALVRLLEDALEKRDPPPRRDGKFQEWSL